MEMTRVSKMFVNILKTMCHNPEDCYEQSLHTWSEDGTLSCKECLVAAVHPDVVFVDQQLND
jgi:hypothetical protein